MIPITSVRSPSTSDLPAGSGTVNRRRERITQSVNW
jgi:hypothetical protein